MINLTDSLFTGEKIRLTALRKSDLPTIGQWTQDPGYLRLYNSHPALPVTEESLNQWLEDWDKSQTQKRFIMRPLDTDECIGFVGLWGISWSNSTTSLSIAIGDRNNWRKGYGRDAMRLILNYAFNELNLHKVGLTVFEYNAGAIALYESLGFQREAILRDYLQRDGKRYAMYYYGLLQPEWKNQS